MSAAAGRLKVYYGIEKTNSVKHKRAVCVLFENARAFRVDNKGNSYQDRFVARQMHLAYTRNQTIEEAADATAQNQVFTSYSLFVDDKRFKGSLEAVLAFNSQADSKNVSRAERERISEALRRVFMEIYPDYREPQEQGLLFTNEDFL